MVAPSTAPWAARTIITSLPESGLIKSCSKSALVASYKHSPGVVRRGVNPHSSVAVGFGLRANCQRYPAAWFSSKGTAEAKTAHKPPKALDEE